MQSKGTEIYMTENRYMSKKTRRASSINAFIFKNIFITCVCGSASNLETSLDAFFALLCNFCMSLLKHWAYYPSETLVLSNFFLLEGRTCILSKYTPCRLPHLVECVLNAHSEHPEQLSFQGKKLSLFLKGHKPEMVFSTYTLKRVWYSD